MKANELKEICENHVADLITAISETKDTKRFLDYLDFCAKFHRYSFRNRILIWTYKPEATFVAGFHAWRQMGRWVRKGEAGIPIFAPMSIKKMQEVEDDIEEDDDKTFLRFKVVYVYDVSQTEGDPLPDMNVLAVCGGNELLGALEDFTRAQGIKLGYSSDKSLNFLRAAGVSARGRIQIRSSLNDSQRFYVLSHELAHEFLHDLQARKELSTKVKELEADATAYVVCSHFGIETRSSVYLALYQVEEVDVKASLDRIVSAASKIIRGVRAIDKNESNTRAEKDAA
ncbi:MAG: ArdC-like ssDNA-binding domain-containing protein [Desulfosalsimonadaceae bacterium]